MTLIRAAMVTNGHSPQMILRYMSPSQVLHFALFGTLHTQVRKYASRLYAIGVFSKCCAQAEMRSEQVRVAW